MKIINITNKTFNQRMFIDMCFIVFYNILVLLLCIFMFNRIILLVFILFIVLDIFAYKFLKNHYEVSEKDYNSDIKYILFNENKIEIYTNSAWEEYDITDLANLSIDIETCTFGVGISYGGCGYHKGCKNIYISFFMQNGKSFKIITHKNTLSGYLNLIYNIIDLLPEHVSFKYSFCGEGYSEEIKAKIEYYQEHNIKK